MNKLLSANTIYELAPYIIKMFPKNKTSPMNAVIQKSTNLMDNLQRYVEKKKLVIRAIYARDITSPSSKRLGKNVQNEIMNFL